MVEMFDWVLDANRFGIGLAKRVPNHIQPVAIAELGCLIPLVCGQPNRLTAPPAFHLNPPDTGHGIAIASLWVGWADAADVEANLEMSHALTFKSSGSLVGNDNVLGGDFALPPCFGIQFVKSGADLLFDGARSGQH